MNYTRDIILDLFEMEEFLDIPKYLKNRKNSFIDFVVSYGITKKDICDLLIEYEKTNPRFPSKKLKDYVLKRDKYSCVKCDSKENLHIDHIYPYSLGGATCEHNLQVLCAKCNLSKHNKTNEIH